MKFSENFGGIPYDAHQLYQATGYDLDTTCNDINVCIDCSIEDGCCAKKKDSVSEYVRINREADMMTEIFAREPIA